MGKVVKIPVSPYASFTDCTFCLLSLTQSCRMRLGENNFSLQDERLPFFASQDFFLWRQRLMPISNDATQYAYEDLLNSSEKKIIWCDRFPPYIKLEACTMRTLKTVHKKVV